MKRVSKLVVLMAVLIMSIGGMNLQTFAAQAIQSVSIRVTSEFQIGKDCSEDDITVSLGDERFYVEHIEIVNEGRQWGSTDIPVVEVYLQALDEYSFSVKKSDIKVNGAFLQGAQKGDDEYSIILTLRFPALTTKLGELNQANWAAGTVGSWDKVDNAGYYVAELYRNGKYIGKAEEIKETQYDFGSMMRRTGTYTFRIRAVNMADTDVKTPWCESRDAVTVDGAMAEQLQNQYGFLEWSGVSEPGLVPKEETYGWIHDHVGWWYRNSDGSYTVNNWQYIDEKWYYFDSVGYMVTGWIEWNGKSYYCNPGSGEMLAGTIVPDGSGRRVDSTGAWIP